ncbi:hypothetical protein JST97_03755 [bacterium]|nr:hypothetical protein [bacterium]
MSQDLAQYLDQLAQEGSPDSQGIFTVDYAKALEKLSARLFSDPTCWLVKLVQAAVASGSRHIQVRAFKDRLEVHFCTPGWTSAQFQNLEELLHQPLGNQEQPCLAHFLRAFHATRSARPQTLAWGVVDSEGGVSYLQRGEQTERQTLPGRPGQGADCVLSLRPAQARAPWAEEHRALAGRCALSPARIQWDKDTLNPGIPQLAGQVLLDRIYLSRRPADQLLHLPHLTQLTSLVYDLGNGYKDHYSYGHTVLHQWRGYKVGSDHKLWESVGIPDFHILESDVIQELFGIPKNAYAINHGVIRGGRLQGRNNGYQILFVQGLDAFTRGPIPIKQGRFGLQRPPCAQAWLRCPVAPQDKSRLMIQQDGVLLDPLPLSVGLSGVQAFVADDKIQTDLSGLVPVRDQRVEMTENWLRSEASKSKKDLRKALRWGDKYGFSEAAVEHISRTHQLDRDD